MTPLPDELFTLRLAPDGWAVEVLDQTRLPHAVHVVRLQTGAEAARAIADMVVRGAPLIGATGAYGLCLALREDPGDRALAAAHGLLVATRPTAVNLRWALDRVRAAASALPPDQRAAAAYQQAADVCREDLAINAAIGEHGRRLIEERWRALGGERP